MKGRTDIYSVIYKRVIYKHLKDVYPNDPKGF
jgi:hypothetical protein